MEVKQTRVVVASYMVGPHFQTITSGSQGLIYGRQQDSQKSCTLVWINGKVIHRTFPKSAVEQVNVTTLYVFSSKPLNPYEKSANFLLMPSRLGCTSFRMTKQLFCLGICIAKDHHRVQCSRTLMLCKKSITAENNCKFIHTVQSTCKLDPYGLIVDVIAWIWIASFLVAPTV